MLDRLEKKSSGTRKILLSAQSKNSHDPHLQINQQILPNEPDQEHKGLINTYHYVQRRFETSSTGRGYRSTQPITSSNRIPVPYDSGRKIVLSARGRDFQKDGN